MRYTIDEVKDMAQYLANSIGFGWSNNSTNIPGIWYLRSGIQGVRIVCKNERGGELTPLGEAWLTPAELNDRCQFAAIAIRLKDSRGVKGNYVV